MTRVKVELSDEEMIAVLREEFIEGAVAPADVFIKLSDNNYLLVSREGEKANFSQLHLAEKKELAYLYIRKTEFKKCVGQKITFADIVIAKAEIDERTKTQFLATATDTVFREIEALGLSQEAVEHARSVALHLKRFVESKPHLLNVVATMAEVPGDLLRHSMAVSSVSVMLGKGMGWSITSTIEKLALGGLLHDIGMKELPPELLKKPRHELTQEEQTLYETHAFRGAEILGSLPNIPDDLVSIALEHHENAIGQGYPRRIRDFKISPLARVVAVANSFCELTLPHESNPNTKSAEEAVEFIENTLGQPFSRPVFSVLKKLLADMPQKMTKS
jgi:putative nucleotidyltransferase with HDIG domain